MKKRRIRPLDATEIAAIALVIGLLMLLAGLYWMDPQGFWEMTK